MRTGNSAKGRLEASTTRLRPRAFENSNTDFGRANQSLTCIQDSLTCVESSVGTDAPTLLLASRSRPVGRPTDLLAMGPAYCSAYVRLHCLVNDLPCWPTGQYAR